MVNLDGPMNIPLNPQMPQMEEEIPMPPTEVIEDDKE